MNKYIDLHMHSFVSDDGEFTPIELVEKCHAAGITIMAVTDHNSVKGIEEAKAAAEKYGIKCIPGIEIDCTYEGVNLHVAGYGIDYKNPVFHELEENILNQELECGAKKIELTNAMGFEVTKEQLDALTTSGVYCGEMFAEVLLNDERYENHELLKPYRRGGDRSDNPYVNFYWDYYAKGKPCYTEIVYPSLAETIQLIKDHGGIAVLAHPGNNLKGQYELFDEMVKLGLQGVEAFSNYHSPEAVEYFLNKGREYNLLITCGSDYHGKTKPAIELGETRCIIDERKIEEMLKEYGLLQNG